MKRINPAVGFRWTIARGVIVGSFSNGRDNCAQCLYYDDPRRLNLMRIHRIPTIVLDCAHANSAVAPLLGHRLVRGCPVPGDPSLMRAIAQNRTLLNAM